MLLEASIELSCQGGSTRSGFSMDIVKCFNNLPRAPVGLASNASWVCRKLCCGLGSPFCLAFGDAVIRSSVGRPLLSTSGYPEGCPLSTVAMVVTGCMFHQYMEQFTPSVQSLSYVDNFVGHAVQAGQAVAGLNAAICFCDAMGLEIDPAKTYVWSNNAPDRRALTALQFPVLDAVRELGGYFSFGRSARNQALQQRCRDLEPLFAALKRSSSPLALKLLSLPTKLWPRALHGVAGCPVSLQLLAALRSDAVKALRVQVGGASALLRLSINERMDCDPGFYQAWHVLGTTRRVCLKQPEMLTMWRLYCQRYDGSRLHGPFTKFFEVIGVLGWTLEAPPMFTDHENLRHDLLRIPVPLLRRLVEAAWLQHVALAHRHRQTMRDLMCIDQDLLRQGRANLCPLDLARQVALQSGSFVFGHAQSKFDPQQDGLCVQCGVADNARHRLCVCPQYAHERRPFQWVCDRWDELPDCLTHHLLVPANPHGPELRRQLQVCQDQCFQYYSYGCAPDTQHLFTDGSCLHSRVPGLALAGWGLVHSSTGLVLACGPVCGLLQSAPRAELCAMLSAVRWVAVVQRNAVIWSDALHVVDTMQQLLRGDVLTGSLENSDLWERIAEEVARLDSTCLRVLHTPSHLDPVLCDSPMEEWLAKWNDHADTVAVSANTNRPQAFVELHARAMEYHEDMARVQQALRGLYCALAARTASEDRRARAVHEEECQDMMERDELPVDELPAGMSLIEALPIGWSCIANPCTVVPWGFTRAVMQFLLEQEDEHSVPFRVSWLELTVILLGVEGFHFPVSCPSTGKWVEAQAFMLPRPRLTLATQMSVVRQGISAALRRLDLGHLLHERISLVSLGVGRYVGGLTVCVNTNRLRTARNQLIAFCAGRNTSTAAAFARPFF